MEIKNKEKILEYIRKGLRLNTPAPKIETSKKTYTRKEKHKKDYESN